MEPCRGYCHCAPPLHTPVPTLPLVPRGDLPDRYLKVPPLKDINMAMMRDGNGWVNCGVVYVQVWIRAGGGGGAGRQWMGELRCTCRCGSGLGGEEGRGGNDWRAGGTEGRRGNG